MRKQIFVSILVVAMMVAGMTLSSFAQTNSESTQPSRQALLDLVNEIRKDDVQLNDILNDAAQTRAEEMAREYSISHERPDGTLFDTVLNVQGERGENVYCGGPMTSEEVPQHAFDGWCTSTTHHQNMLDDKWGYMGVGYSLGDDDIWYVCQLFSSSRPKEENAEGSPDDGSLDQDDEGAEAEQPDDEPDSAPTEDADPDDETDETEESPEPAATEEVTGDPDALIWKLEAPERIVAGETIVVKAVLNPAKSFTGYTWNYPGKYYGKTSESADKLTFRLQTKTADTIEIKFTAHSGRQQATVSKTIQVSNSFAAEITGPAEVKPGQRATFKLDVDERAAAKDIKWSVIPGLCTLDFTDDKRELVLIAPPSGEVELIAKIELDGKTATVRKKVQVVTTLDVNLEGPKKAQVGQQMEVKAVFDGYIAPLNIYWTMYPGTCDARFSADMTTMYFTPTTTDTLEIGVRINRDDDYGTARLVVPVAQASAAPTLNPVTVTSGGSQSGSTAISSARPVTVVSSGQTGGTNAASSASIPAGSTKPVSVTSGQGTSSSSISSAGTGSGTSGALASLNPVTVTTGSKGSSTSSAAASAPAAQPSYAYVPGTGTVQIVSSGAATILPSGSSTVSNGAGSPQSTSESVKIPSQSLPTVTVTSMPGASTTAPAAGPTDAPMSELRSVDSSPIRVLPGEDGGTLIVAMGHDEEIADVAEVINGLDVPDGMRIRITDGSGKVCSPYAKAATGQTIAVTNANGETVLEATVVIPGDVLGKGVIDIAQLARIAKAMNAQDDLFGAYLQAAKVSETGTGSGQPDILDIIRVAKLIYG